MADRPPRRPHRLPVRLYNGGHRLLERLGRARVRFADSEEALREAACRATGLDDFGEGDWEEGLRVLLQAYDGEAGLNPFGRMMVTQEIGRILRNRLSAAAAWRAHPEILEIPVRRPVFILGLPRTGTTVLHHLLAQDPANQVLEYWIAAAPGPRPPRDAWVRDPRFRSARRDLWTMYYLDPGLKAIHLMTADGPDECRHLLQQTFTDDTFECNATIPSYSSWYATHDMGGSYRRHRDLLRLIGSTAPDRRWVLKYPAHMRHLRTLLEIHPDACLVQTHRDPGRVLPSLCSLIAGWRGIYEDDPDGAAIGRWQLEVWSDAMREAMEVRKETDVASWYDLHFRDVLEDPIGAVRGLYAHLGLDLDPQAEAVMRRWLAANPQGAHGAHHYSADQFGLRRREMSDRFAPYLEHFGIAPEDEA